MQQLEPWLQEKLDDFSLQATDILSHNTIKRRYILEAFSTVTGQVYLVKANNPVIAEYSSPLDVEIQYYRTHPQARYLPQMYTSAASFIVLEMLTVKTLRSAILSREPIRTELLNQFESHLSVLTEDICTVAPEVDFCESALSRMHTLLYSGPADNSPALSRRLLRPNSVIDHITCHRTHTFLHKLTTQITPSSHYIHGDFHLNNILISLDGDQVYIIDWERYGPGYVAVEFAFCCAQLELLAPCGLAGRSPRDMFITSFSPNFPDQIPLFEKVTDLCVLYGKLNPRFASSSYRWTDWLRALFSFIWYMVTKMRTP